jgi:hypothetical protein
MSKSTSGLVILAAMALALSAQVSPKAVRTAAEMEPLLASIAKYEYGQSRVAQAEFTQFVQDSLASPALLKQIEARLLAFVQSDATAPAKQFALRELSLIGTDASVPVLAPMVLQPATSEMARFALARIPGPAVDQALRDDLAKSSGNIRIGVVESLAQRRCEGGPRPRASFRVQRPGHRGGRRGRPGRHRGPAVAECSGRSAR